MCKSKCNTEKPYILITGGKIDFNICSVNKTTFIPGITDVYGHNGHFAVNLKRSTHFKHLTNLPKHKGSPESKPP